MALQAHSFGQKADPSSRGPHHRIPVNALSYKWVPNLRDVGQRDGRTVVLFARRNDLSRFRCDMDRNALAARILKIDGILLLEWLPFIPLLPPGPNLTGAFCIRSSTATVAPPINPHVLHTSTPPNTHSTAPQRPDRGAPISSISGANASNHERPKSLTTPTTSRLPTQDAVPAVPTPLLPGAFCLTPPGSTPATAQIHPAIFPTISLHFRVSAPIDQMAQTFRSPRTPAPSAPVASSPCVPRVSNGPPRRAYSTYFHLHSPRSKPPAILAKAHLMPQASAPKASHSTPTYVPSQSSLNKKNRLRPQFYSRSGRRTTSSVATAFPSPPGQCNESPPNKVICLRRLYASALSMR